MRGVAAAAAWVLLSGCSGEVDAPETARKAEGGAANMVAGGRAGAGGAASGRGGMGTGGGAGSAGLSGSAGATTLNCSAGQTQCGPVCVDTMLSPAHCGGCDRPCGGSQSCSAGMCFCENGGTVCGTSCSDLQTDKAHCGTCATSCSTEQSCVAGKCACPAPLMACGAACVDVQTSSDHCGGCNTPCGGGSTCSAGKCVCPTGQLLCASSCVDVNSSMAHCGECDAPCEMGQTCSAGRCTGSGNAGEDGCTGGAARNVTLSRIDVLQTVHIRVMDYLEAIPTSERNADVVEKRESVFRIFVTPDTGWTARELSARVTLVNGDSSEEFFTKKMVSGKSDAGDAGTTIQVTVPAEAVLEDTEYAIELVECGTPPTGAAVAPRFPATGSAALGVRKTGPLKVRVIPITSNSRTPDTSEAGLEPYLKLLEAIYPADAVELDVGDAITAGYPVDWNGTLDAVRAKRQSDRPDDDVYYYGLIRPTDTFQQFCQGGCTAGIGFVPQLNDSSRRVSMGIGFPGDQSPGAMAHEIGHNHGRNHAPCVPQGASIDGVDRDYPYEGGNIGTWGYDNRSKELIDPEGVTDLMGYCNRVWASDYTYQGLVDRVAAVNSAKLRVNPDVIGRYRVLLLDRAGPRWGHPITELVPPAGAPEVAEIYDEDADVLENVVVYRTEVSEIDAASIMVPEPEPGWHSVKVSGSAALPFSAPALGAP